MTIKLINQKIYNNVLSKNAVNRQIIRNNEIIDSDFLITSLAKTSKVINNNFTYYNLYNFKHRRSNTIELEMYLTTTQIENSQTTSNFVSTLKSLNSTTKNTLNLIHAVKGGFLALHKNIIGFIPGSHALKSIKQFKNHNKNESLEKDVYLSNLHNSNKSIFPKIYFKTCKINILPQHIKKNFSSFKRKKSESKVNFIFLIK